MWMQSKKYFCTRVQNLHIRKFAHVCKLCPCENSFTLSKESSIHTLKVSVKRHEVRYSERCASMTDLFEAMIWTICLQVVSNKSLRKEIRTWLNHWSEIKAFKMHVEIAFSNFDPTWKDFNFEAFVVILIFRTLNSFLYLDMNQRFQSVISVQRKHAFNIHVKFLVLFSLLIHRGSYMSGHLIWNLWNSLCNLGILRAFGEQNTEITQRVS